MKVSRASGFQIQYLVFLRSGGLHRAVVCIYIVAKDKYIRRYRLYMYIYILYIFIYVYMYIYIFTLYV